MPSRSGQVRQLLEVVARAYNRRSWHGTNLKGAIRGLDVDVAAFRPGPRRHNIWELVVHAAYWKYVVRRRLTGEKRGAFALRGSNWFERPEPGGPSTQAWRRDVALLDAEHRQLVQAVGRLTDRDLTRVPAGNTESWFALVAGIAAHDLYHAGQIQLLKRLAGGASNRAPFSRQKPRKPQNS